MAWTLAPISYDITITLAVLFNPDKVMALSSETGNG
jgi:hypothetical protein